MQIKNGTTLSDECRKLAEKLAEEQRKQEDHDAWLEEQITAAFTKLAEGRAVFTSHEEAKAKMLERKMPLRESTSNLSCTESGAVCPTSFMRRNSWWGQWPHSHGV